MKLTALTSVNDDLFVKELRKVEKLREDDGHEFFRILTGHLQTIQNPDIAREIYLAIQKAISRKDLLSVFISGNFLSQLPFNRKAHFEHLLDVIYTLVTRAPNSLDASFAANFQNMVRHRGRKCLIILSIYAQHFNNLSDPWPMLDLLFYEQERFTVFDVVSQYVSLLSLLCQSFPEFRRSRGANSWDVIMDVISHEDADEILATCWEALTGIESFEHGYPIDYRLMQRQFAHSELRSAILSFMIVSPLHEITVDATFVGRLLKTAKKDTRAVLVLMKLARASYVSEMLSADTEWMSLPLPRVIDTLRLALVVFSHEKAKDAVRKAPELVQLLCQLNQVRSPAMTTLLAAVVRNLKLGEEEIQGLSECGFFRQFFDRGDILKDIVIMADTVAGVCYIDELCDVCGTLKDVLETETSDFDVICRVGMKMARHKRVRKAIVKSGIPAVLLKRSKVAETAKMAKRFLAKLE